MAMGRVRIWFPDGPSHVVPLLEEPRRGEVLVATGVRKGAWVVSDLRASQSLDAPVDVWVEAAPSDSDA
jgi:hypothetical protein